MYRVISNHFRGTPIAIIGALAVVAFAVGVIFLLISSSTDQTGQTASQGGTPTEQVKAAPVGTASSTTTGTAPRNQEGR